MCDVTAHRRFKPLVSRLTIAQLLAQQFKTISLCKLEVPVYNNKRVRVCVCVLKKPIGQNSKLFSQLLITWYARKWACTRLINANICGDVSIVWLEANLKINIMVSSLQVCACLVNRWSHYRRNARSQPSPHTAKRFAPERRATNAAAHCTRSLSENRGVVDHRFRWKEDVL